MTIQRIIRLITLLLIVCFAVWAIYLLIIGLPVERYLEVPLSERLPSPQLRYEFYAPAIFSLISLILILFGLIRDEWIILAWVGVGSLAFFGGLTIWSMGIVFIAEATTLAVPLSMLHWQITGNSQWYIVTWISLLLLLLFSVLFVRTDFGPYILATFLVMGFFTGTVQWNLHSSQSSSLSAAS